MQSVSEHTFAEGIRDGIPICLGYLSVSFGFGVLVVNGGLSWLTAVLISLTNVTSAGQLAGLDIMIAGGALVELITTEFIINIRYALMSISLTQKLDSSFNLPNRLLCSFGITDEIFGVAASKRGVIGAKYMYGLIILPVAGWTAGTLLGALAGSVLPKIVLDSMGIMLYAMFIAIVLPPATKSRAVAMCAVIAAACSVVFNLVPFFSFITPGFRVVLSALIASVPAAVMFPVKEEEGA